jgi:hypothetical protein
VTLTPTAATGITSRYAIAAGLVDPPERQWLRDPVTWARERLGVTLWSKQREIIESVRDNSDTAVHSCHEIGKSFVAALTACWWIDVHPPGSAFVITTAPTQDQVEAILWKEINKMHTAGGLRGRTNLTEWYLGKELVALGRKPSEHNTSRFQGHHALYFLVIYDEACGVPKEIWDGGSTLAANRHGRQLAIGNPDDPHGEFAAVCRPGSGWNTIHVGYKDTPNFTGEDVPELLKDSLIHPRWVESRKRKWGEHSAIYVSKVEGKFPVDSDKGVIPYSWANACRGLEYPADEPAEGGIDVGAGGDRTVIRERRGRVAGREAEFRSADPMATIGQLVEKINEWGLTRVKVDVIGIGWALAGRLAELSSVSNPYGNEHTHNAEVVTVNFGAGAPEGFEKKFLNMRAYVYWQVGRENSRLKLWDLSTLDDDVMAELTTPEYVILDSFGKIKIQPKDEVRKILGESPDRADALLLAFFERDFEATMIQPSDTGRLPLDLLRNITPGQYGLRR